MRGCGDTHRKFHGTAVEQATVYLFLSEYEIKKEIDDNDIYYNSG